MIPKADKTVEQLSLAKALDERYTAYRAKSSPELALALTATISRLLALPEEERVVAFEAERAKWIWREEGEVIRELALEALDLDGLIARAYELAERPMRAASLTWAERCLEIGYAAPLLPEAAREHVASTLEHLAGVVESHERSFSAVRAWSVERAAVEAELGNEGSIAETFLVAMVAEPWLDDGAMDRFREEEPEAYWGADEHWLREMLQRQPRDLVEQAEAALGDRRDWKVKVRTLRRAAREAARRMMEAYGIPDGEAPPRPVALLAADAMYRKDEEHLLLRRLPEGELTLSRSGHRLFVDWYGEGEAGLRNTAGEELPSSPIEGGQRWHLPDDGAFTFSVDTHRLQLRLPDEAED